jgi:hypothetical protein
MDIKETDINVMELIDLTKGGSDWNAIETRH